MVHVARILTQAAVTQGQKAISLISKDLSWLWRTAYNCALQGYCEWDSTSEQATEFFNIAREVKRSHCPDGNPNLMSLSYWRFPVLHQQSARMPSPGSTLRTPPLLLCPVKVSNHPWSYCDTWLHYFHVCSLFCKIVYDHQLGWCKPSCS